MFEQRIQELEDKVQGMKGEITTLEEKLKEVEHSRYEMMVDEREGTTKKIPPLTEDKEVGTEQEIVAMEIEAPTQDNQQKLDTLKACYITKLRY